MRSENKIRDSYKRLLEKIDNIKFFEKASILASLYKYPQITPKFNEVLFLIFSGKVILLFKVLFKLIFNR